MNPQTRQLLIQRAMDPVAAMGPGSIFERFSVILIEFLLDIKLVQRGSSVGGSPVGGALDATTDDGKIIVEASILKDYFGGGMAKPRGDLEHALKLAPRAEDIYLLCSQRAPTGVIEAFVNEIAENPQMAGRRIHVMDGRSVAEAIVDRLILQDGAVDALSELLPALSDIRDDHPASLLAPPITPLYVERGAVDAEIDSRLAAGICVEISGIGGAGKSQAAAACLARNAASFEYSFWIDAREIEGVEQLSSVQLRRGGASRNVSGLLGKNRTLIVLDDAPDGLTADQLARVCGHGSKILVTRRKSSQSSYAMPMMDKPRARELLGKDLSNPPTEVVFVEIWKAVGGHPLSLRLINSAVKTGIEWADIAEDCRNIARLPDGAARLADRILERLRPILSDELSVFLWAGQRHCDRAFLRSVIGALSLATLERYGLTAPESPAAVRIHDIVFSALNVADWLSPERAKQIDDNLESFILKHVRDHGHGLQAIATHLHGKIARNVEAGDRRPAFLYALTAIWTGSAVRVDLLPEPVAAALALAGQDATEHDVSMLVVLESTEARCRHLSKTTSDSAAVEWASSILEAYDHLDTMARLSPRQVAEIGYHRAKTVSLLRRPDDAEKMLEAVVAGYPLHDATLQLIRLLDKKPGRHSQAKQAAEEIIAAHGRGDGVSSSLLMELGDILNGARKTWGSEIMGAHEELFLNEALYSASAGVSQGYHSIASFVRALVWHDPRRVQGVLARLPEPTPLMLDDDQSRGGYAEIMLLAAGVANDEKLLGQALAAFEALKVPDSYQKRKWGETLHRLGRTREAETLLESFTDESGHIWLAHSLSQVKFALGKLESALQLVDEAVAGAVGSNQRYLSSFLLQRAKVKIALGRDAGEDIAEGGRHTDNPGLLKQLSDLHGG